MNIIAILAGSQNGDGGVRPRRGAAAGAPKHRPRLPPGTAHILTTQAALGALTTAVWWECAGPAAAGAAAAGSVLAMAGVILLGLRLMRDLRRPTPLGLGAGERFLLTALVFAAAIGRLHLPALPLLAGFACAQLGYLAGTQAAEAA